MYKRSVVVLSVLILTVLAAISAGAAGEFVEADAAVIHTVNGDGGAYFGWVAANLGDITGDGVNEFITSDITLAGLSGKIYIYDGANGSLVASQTGLPGSLFGYSTTLAGDVNNDGVPDYIAGAPWGDRAVVYSGADHTVLYDLAGTSGSSYGSTVAGLGDINGDGHGDFLVGADDYGAELSGRAEVYSGLDGALIRGHDGELGANLGTAAGKIGDIDGDDVPDYVVGARSAGNQGRGQAYAFSGAGGELLFAMEPVGLPGDGYPTFALFFASGAGDVNGDGTPDIYVGDYNAARGGTADTGRAYVFSGRNGERIRMLNAQVQGEGFGPGRGIGDLDGDGHGDLIVGAYSSNEGADSSGKAYLISGKNGNVMRTMTGAVPYLSVGVDALPLGDVNGDGLGDYVLTGFGIVYVVAGTQ